MSRPRLLDLYSGAGGAAVGYHRAGFEVVGVDCEPQPHYPFEFHQADALEFLAEHGLEYDAIHASPPCQGYSRLQHLPWLKHKTYPLLIEPTRELLQGFSAPWVIENVEDAPLVGITLCGLMFGLRLYRHRKFESNLFLMQPPHGKHQVVISHGRNLGARISRASGRVCGVLPAKGKPLNGLRDNPSGVMTVAGHYAGQEAAREAMGIDWMTREEMAQSIPPIYTEWIGRALLEQLI